MDLTWNELIERVSELYISGLSESEISSRFAGTNLSGSGEIKRLETDGTMSSPFIQLNMPRIEVPHKNKTIVGDFLALNFSELGSEKVSGIHNGDVIRFRTCIIEKNGPFPGVGVSEFDDEKEIIIMLGTAESQIA